MDDFSTSLVKLRVAVNEACGKHDEWPAGVAAGIYAVLDFATANPGAAYVLAIDLRLAEPGEDDRYTQMIEHFSQLLGDGAPRNDLPSLTDEALVSTIVAVVADHLRSGRVDRLDAVGPDLVCLTLLPYLGFAEAKRWT